MKEVLKYTVELEQRNPLKVTFSSWFITVGVDSGIDLRDALT